MSDILHHYLTLIYLHFSNSGVDKLNATSYTILCSSWLNEVYVSLPDEDILSARRICLLWQNLVGCSNLLLPSQLVLAEDLRTDWKAFAAIKQDGASHDRVFTHDLLVVIDMAGALRAKVAVDALA